MVRLENAKGLVVQDSTHGLVLFFYFILTYRAFLLFYG